MDSPRTPDESKGKRTINSVHIWTIPNIITFIRLGLTPVFIYLALNSPVTGALMLGVLASTDFIDGYIARKFNQISELGRILDPISDRLLTFCAFIVFIITDSLPLWFVLVFGLRELFVSLGTIFIGIKKKIRLDVNQTGKLSALAAMIAIPAWVFQSEFNNLPKTIFLLLAVIFSLISIISGYISVFQYIKSYIAIRPSNY